MALALLTPAIAACAQEAPSVADQPHADPALRFEGAAPTLDMLGEQVLRALSRADTGALEWVRLTEREHNDVVWPELPASAPEVSFPLDFAWGNIQMRNRRAIARIMPAFQSRDFGFQRVECRGQTQEFQTFHVHTDCFVVFTQGGSPELYEAQLFKDVLERGGGVKIFRYYDEEPRRYRSASKG